MKIHPSYRPSSDEIRFSIHANLERWIFSANTDRRWPHQFPLKSKCNRLVKFCAVTNVHGTYAKHFFGPFCIHISRVHLLLVQMDSRLVLNPSILRQYGTFVCMKQPVLFVSIVLVVFETPHVNVLTQIARIVCIWQPVASHKLFPLKEETINLHNLCLNKLAWHRITSFSFRISV